MSILKRRLKTSLFLGLLLFAFAGCGSDSPSRTFQLAAGPTFTVSGTITAAAANAVDSDTNDPEAPHASNDSYLTPQLLPNPVVLGGYASAAPTGGSGDRFSGAPDTQDWYRMTLAAGETIVLTIADHDGNAANAANPDFDLFLLDVETVTDVQSAEGLGRQEAITVLADGEYYLQVYSFQSGSNYTLRVDQAPSPALAPTLHIEDEFVPGEIIVRLREAPPVAGVAARSVAARAAALGLNLKAGRPGGPMLMKIASSLPGVRSLAGGGSLARSKGRVAPAQQAKRETIDRVKALRRQPEVLSADLNYLRKPLFLPDDPLLPSQWNLSMINLPPAWDLTTGGSSVVIAVVDTGVLFGHPDLAGRLCTATDDCRGYDFISDLTTAADGDGLDPDPSDPGDGNLPDGASTFHGTHVAGIAGAAGNNGVGVAGIDWGAKIMPVRVLGVDGGTAYDVVQGVRYAAGLSNDSGTIPAQKADIINLSLGGGGYTQVEQGLYNQLHAEGVLVVSAAGNDGGSLPGYPASYDGVVSVSAVDIDGNLAPYSSYGIAVDVAAPGGSMWTDRNGDGLADGVVSTCGDDHFLPVTATYVPYAGTSMAASHVTGVAALMKGVDPALTPGAFDTLLSAGTLTVDLGGDGAATRNDSFGYGLIDAQKGVLQALALAGGGTLPPSLAASPSYLNFGATTGTLPLSLANAGGGTLNVTVSASAPWITVTPTAGVAADGLGDYEVSVDRAGLSDGTYVEGLTVLTDAGGSLKVSVFVQVGASGVANAGYQWIDLIDAASGVRLKRVGAAADPVDGTYRYAFKGVPRGSYLVKAGTDSDHDGSICDPGEACGGYPLVNAADAIPVVDHNLIGIDFASGF